MIAKACFPCTLSFQFHELLYLSLAPKDHHYLGSFESRFHIYISIYIYIYIYVYLYPLEIVGIPYHPQEHFFDQTCVIDNHQSAFFDSVPFTCGRKLLLLNAVLFVLPNSLQSVYLLDINMSCKQFMPGRNWC